MASRLNGLSDIEAVVWGELARAATDRTHAWRTPVLATVEAGGVPDARTIVLREVDADARRLVLYSDARAGKIAQLAAQPLAMLVFWSPALSWQLRVRARVRVDTDGLAVATRWAALTLTPAAQDYLSPMAPGAPLAVADDAWTARREPPTRGHFSVLTAQAQVIDWLELHAHGHRRARFATGAAPAWIAP